MSDSGKASGAFRTIREVSEEVGVAPHILRFWETRFPQLKPLQRGGNRRYYRPADVTLAKALQKLLHQDGYTVKGVQKLIATDGLAAVLQHGGEEPADSTPAAPKTMPEATAATLPADAIARLRQARDRLAAALAA